MRLAIFTLSLLFGLSAVGQTFAVRISTNTALTQGDQVIWSGSAWVVYGKGTNGQVLTMSGTNVVWANPTGGSGGGTGLVSSVSADFEVDAGELNITNTTGTGAILRTSSLSPYLLSATAASTYATLESPSFTGTVSFETIQADAVQVPFASLYASANSSSNLTGTLDGGSWTNLNGTEIRSGTVAAAWLDPAMARLASPAFTTSATIGGTNILDYAASHLTEAEASALYQRTNSTLTRVAGIGAGTTGDLLYRDATGWTNLAKGTQGQYLAVTATVPAWSNAPAADVQVFSAVGSNTWTKPSGKTMVYVLAIGGGGGGGAGRRGAAGTIRSGGAGGAPGGYSDNWLPASALGSTETVTVGGGGAGASVQTSNDANGSNGTSGTNSTFGNWVFAGGGFSGGGGDADGATASTAGYGKFTGPIGAASSATGAAGTTANGSSTSSAGVVPAGGGSGGGITSGNSASNGGAGGEGPRMWRGSSQLPGGTAGSSGGSGGAGNAAGADVYIGGSGGGGGASSISAAAGAGGDGGTYGAGGGGGGASLNGNNSGAGGNGGNGIVVVISY